MPFLPVRGRHRDLTNAKDHPDPVFGKQPDPHQRILFFFTRDTRTGKFPLIIETDTEELVQGVHPGDLILVSAAERIELRCDIRRGTHPEQHLLCTADEFTGMLLYTDSEELVIENCRGAITASVLSWTLSLTEEKIE